MIFSSTLKKANVTIHQAQQLAELGFTEPTMTITHFLLHIPSVDQAIDWLRRKHNIIIYNAMAPFVDPRTNKIILYRFAVKCCNLRDGWNGRIMLQSSKLTGNIYAAKREAISIAIKYLKNEQLRKTKRRSSR